MPTHDELRDKGANMGHTPTPWRIRRCDELKDDRKTIDYTRWEIVAGSETPRVTVSGLKWTEDEHTVVACSTDRDYGYYEGGIGNEEDAALIVRAVNSYAALERAAREVVDIAATCGLEIGSDNKRMTDLSIALTALRSALDGGGK